MARIAQLTTYPTTQPRHGGQIRAHHTARALEAAGHAVIRLPVFYLPYHLAQNEDSIVDLTSAFEKRRYPDIPEIVDFTLSELVATDEAYFASFAARLDRAHPDIVMLEEPWLWPALRRWSRSRAGPPPIIFNSYNIETQAKASILADCDYAETGGIVAEIAALEHELARCAAGISVTTTADAATLRAVTDAPIVLARNGAAARSAAPLQGVLPAPLKPNQRYLLFVGSGHPPNATGFLAMALPALPMLRSNERIVVAGSVCGLIQSRLALQGPNALVRDRTVFLGPVSPLGLDCLLSNAAGILLPITYGGGSNLKTAEALSTGLPIAATSIAFRGFEEYQHLPQVIIADTAEEFRHAVRRTLQISNGAQREWMVTELQWQKTLQPIAELVNSLSEHLTKIITFSL